MIKLFLSSLGTKLTMILLVASTLVTTGVAVTKVAQSFGIAQIPRQGLSIESAPDTETQEEVVENIPDQKSQSVAQVVSVKSVKPAVPTVSPKLFPTSAPIAAVPTTVATNGGCIISLFGVQYDITSLLTTHSGGNVFKCGTDMTALYSSKHGTSVARMQKYILANATNQGGNNNTVAKPTSGKVLAPTDKPYQYKDDNDERDDKENENRYVEIHDVEDQRDD